MQQPLACSCLCTRVHQHRLVVVLLVRVSLRLLLARLVSPHNRAKHYQRLSTVQGCSYCPWFDVACALRGAKHCDRAHERLYEGTRRDETCCRSCQGRRITAPLVNALYERLVERIVQSTNIEGLRDAMASVSYCMWSHCRANSRYSIRPTLRLAAADISK